jgi:hypothetical protein
MTRRSQQCVTRECSVPVLGSNEKSGYIFTRAPATAGRAVTARAGRSGLAALAFARTPFRNGEVARAAVSRDGDTRLNLYVYDPNGNSTASAVGPGDDCPASWVPKWTGTSVIEVVNRGVLPNRYVIVTNWRSPGASRALNRPAGRYGAICRWLTKPTSTRLFAHPLRSIMVASALRRSSSSEVAFK